MRYLIFTLVLLVLPSFGSAHHSRAEFANEIREIEGEVVEVAWRNPHPVLTLRTTNDAGENELWDVEGWQSANVLSRKGVAGDVFTVGQNVRAAVRRSNRRPQLLLGISISLGDGTQALLRPGFEPYWPDEAVVGSNAPALASANSNSPNDQALGLFRVWSFVDREGPLTLSNDGDTVSATRAFEDQFGAVEGLPLTAAAIQRQAQFDELADHPMWNCDPVGMPVVMDTGLPVQFIDQGENILLRIEQNDATRTIHLNPNPGADNQSPSILGYSVGHWEGNSLIVRTTNSTYPYLDDDGTAKSENMEITERFTLGSDGNSLGWEAMLTDPEFLTEPIVVRMNWEWVPGEAIKSWNCAVSGSGRAAG
ncbi:MAG: DUF6152 family protein [Pseudomonadota bacterium]|nr:DUF6152 family protein [Pseudomonadota bacterium]